MSKILETETEGYGPSFAIHGFMRYLGLRPAQLVAYALIYSCTVDKGCYDFGAAVLADWSGTSERTARTTIASLLEMGLVVERGSHVHGMNTVGRSLVAATEPIVRAREAWQADHPDAGRSSFRISPVIFSGEDSSSLAKTSRDVSSREVSSPENTSSPENISRENTSSPEISSGEDSSSPVIFSGEDSSSLAKTSRDVSSREVSSPENTSSPENISRENTSSPEISSGEDSSSPVIFSGESPYIPISNDYPEDWTDGWMDFQTNQPDVYPGMDSQVDTASDFRKIADETINRNKLDAARQPYDELRRLGFGADEIGTAWARRQADAKDAGCEDKFMPQLRKWLLDTSVKGCRKMVEAARQRTGRGEKHLRRAPDGAWLIIGDGPVHPVVDANGIVYRGDNKEAAIDLARKQATSLL
ncbi:hypothetical protein [Collinsella sp. i06-0019-1H4]|uniref:hypothetical protein n=1 Tax=Collinsella sp. i06-0019-1H4 TaxID=3132706 RepID=UPI0036F36C30